MPSEKKHRSKEDTWGAEELSKSIKEVNSDRRKHRDRDKEKERRSRHRDDDRNDSAEKRHRDRRKDKGRDDDKNDDDRKHRDRRHREDGEPRDRGKEKEHRKDKERREHHRDDDDRHKDRDKHRDKDREKDRDRDRERKHAEDDDRRRRDERRRRRIEEEEQEQAERRRRKQREEGEDEDRRSKDERRRRKIEEEEQAQAERRRRKRREEKEDEGERKPDRERRHRDKNDDDSRDRSHRDRDRERRHRTDEDDEERRKRHEEKKRRKQEEEERQRKSDERNGDERNRSKRDKNKGAIQRHQGKGQSFKVKRQAENAPTVDYEEQPRKEEEGKQVVMGKEDDYNYDDDDFEDYDDDFEDDDGDDGAPTRILSAQEREMEELRRALAEENTSSKRRQYDRDDYASQSPSSDTYRPRTGRGGRSFVNFVAATQRVISDKVSSKTKKRGKELMRLIDLDIASFDMFDLPPLKEYELYIKNFGRSDTRQAYVQCNEDNIDRDIQTEDIEYRQKWTQYPADDMIGCGGGDGDTIDDEEEAIYTAKKKDIDSVRLVNFLQNSGQVVSVLLEENLADKTSGTLTNNQRQIVFSEGYIELNSKLPFLKHRHVVYLHFHPVQTHLILTAYSMPQKASSKNKLYSKGLICLWNVNEPTRPQKVLSCESAPLCCCFSPSKATLAFAGTVDGTAVVWDLREPSSMHHTHNIESEEWLIRMPTYSTDGIQCEDNHHSPVVTVLPIVSPTDSFKALLPKGAGAGNVSDETAGLSFQLATVEQQAIINFWTVVEISKPDKAGSESDLGLIPGGKVKLIKSSNVKLISPVRDVKVNTAIQAFQMQLLPKDPNHLYVGTDLGYVLHAVRYGGKAPPNAFKSEIDVPVDVVAVDFSPFGLPCFLAGCVDGSLRLHSTTAEQPLVTWPNSTSGMAVVNVKWSQSRPAVFFVIDETAKVYVWDLLHSDGIPIKIEQFNGGRLTACSLSNDHAATGFGLQGRRPEIAIGVGNGDVEIHRLNQQFYQASPDELDKVTNFLERIM
ncbi:cytoplasmic dynein 2 intermediate chain 1-like [Saccoglossus kowalevskii]|uniref:WD repeat-containing protein 60-like n=1 Tax=Saccoglossus kowalevskii TaxID=10224 RepID=A0ABM0M776_SACKO|nr:PREDICTED: WD repeat-containing protein 60-like [Saccoglossus kowalevskii]